MKQNPVLLSMGGNIGNVEAAFHAALHHLKENGFSLSASSSVYHSKALGCEPGAPDFCNISVLGTWDNSPERLLDLIQKLEIDAGRPPDHPHWVSRVLDIDLILMGDLILKTERLTLPHPEMLHRDFVLIPSAEIAPMLPVPGTGRVIRDFLP